MVLQIEDSNGKIGAGIGRVVARGPAPHGVGPAGIGAANRSSGARRREANAAPFSELLPGVAGQEAPAAGRGGPGRGGRGGRGGAMVKPGTYTVTLGRVASGVLMPIGDPQTVEVVALEASNR